MGQLDLHENPQDIAKSFPFGIITKIERDKNDSARFRDGITAYGSF